jgi:hypothetical protein
MSSPGWDKARADKSAVSRSGVGAHTETGDCAVRLLDRTCAITALAAGLAGTASGLTLESVLVGHGIPVADLPEHERQQAITSFAVSADRRVFLLAYYDYDGPDRLPPLIRIFRFDKATDRQSRGALRDTDIRIDPSLGEIAKFPGICLGALLHISEENGLIAIDTHINPSAGCVLLLDAGLRFKAALPGWLLGRVRNQLIVEGNMMHFAPTSPGSLGIFDPEGKQLIPIYPNADDERRREFSKLLEDHLPSQSWCQEFNNPCDPKNFTTGITNVTVEAARNAFSFEATMSAEGFGKDVEAVVRPQTVRYECEFRSGKWVLTSQ